MRSLEFSTGSSKSGVSGGLRCSRRAGLSRTDRKSSRPQVNTRGLLELIRYGLTYFRPAEPGARTRGIPTAQAAPVLAARLISAGKETFVWPDALGLAQGVVQATRHVGATETVALRARFKSHGTWTLICSQRALQLGETP